MNADVFNIGSGKETSVKTLVEKIIELTGAKAKIEFQGEETDARERLKIEKAAKQLGWKPKYDLENALKETIEWYRKNQG